MSASPHVDPHAGSPPHPPSESACEPVFDVQADRLRTCTAHAGIRLRHLGFHLARHPADLAAHTRRVLLARAAGDAEALRAALLDLGAALCGRGRPLLANLLERTRGLLSEESHRALAGILEAVPDAAVMDAAGCRLQPPPGRALVRRQATARAGGHGDDSALARALSHLDDGRPDDARAVLEEALARGVEEPAVSELLIDIYRRARDGAAIRAMRERTREAGEPVRTLWSRALDLAL